MNILDQQVSQQIGHLNDEILENKSNIQTLAELIENKEQIDNANLLNATNQGSRNWMFSNDNIGTYSLGEKYEDGVNAFHFEYIDNTDEALVTSWECFMYTGVQTDKIESGETYTLSMDIRQISGENAELIKLQFGIMNPNASNILVPLGTVVYNPSFDEWNRINILMTPIASGVKGGQQVIYIGVHSTSRQKWDNLDIRNLQLVKGNLIDEWKVSASDMNSLTKNSEVLTYVSDVWYGETYDENKGSVVTSPQINKRCRTNKFMALSSFTAHCKFNLSGSAVLTVHTWNGRGEYLGNLHQTIAAGSAEYSWNLNATSGDAYYALSMESDNTLSDFKVDIEYTVAAKQTVNKLSSDVNKLNEEIIEKAAINYVKGGSSFKFNNALFDVTNNNLTRTICAVSGLKSGDEITISFDYEISGMTFQSDSRIWVSAHDQWGYQSLGFSAYENGSGHHSYTLTVTTTKEVTEDTIMCPYIGLRYMNGDANSVIRISNIKIVKGKEEKKNTVSLLDLNYRTGYLEVSSLNHLMATKRTVYCQTNVSQGIYFYSYDMIPNGEEMHILVKNTHATNNITISIPTNFVSLSGDSITIKPGGVGEINFLRIDHNYYVRTIQ